MEGGGAGLLSGGLNSRRTWDGLFEELLSAMKNHDQFIQAHLLCKFYGGRMAAGEKMKNQGARKKMKKGKEIRGKLQLHLKRVKIPLNRIVLGYKLFKNSSL